MEPSDFKKWRKALKLSQKEAAHALGLKRRMIQYYESGKREGEKVVIPLSVRLACSGAGRRRLSWAEPKSTQAIGLIVVSSACSPSSRHPFQTGSD